MALPPAFLDELRQRTPLPALIGRRVKLTRSSRDWRGCCPFHNEKTPSFYVYQDHYHCFGCGAHGDAIGFVMQSQGAGFVQAVEVLAAEAGLEVPRDISVVGFDGTEDANRGALSLTTVVVPLAEITEMAVDMLVDRIEDPTRPAVSQVLPVQLRLGESTASPKG